MPEIDVINLRTWKPADSPPGHTYVYAGRRAPNRPGSPLANPFKLASEDLRAACLRKYDEWLDEQLPTSPARRELRRLIDLAKQGPLVLFSSRSRGKRRTNRGGMLWTSELQFFNMRQGLCEARRRGERSRLLAKATNNIPGNIQMAKYEPVEAARPATERKKARRESLLAGLS